MSDDRADFPTARKARKTGASSRPSAARYRSHHFSANDPAADMLAAVSTFGRDVFCVFDAKLACLSLSENWEMVTGFSAHEDVGDGLKSRIAPDHLRKVTNYLFAAASDADPTRFQVKHKTGHWRWCELQLVDAAESGSQPRYTCLLRDVTELLTTQGKFEKAKLEAELAIKSRSEFLANMSHELRTPLNAILGFAQMIENGVYGDVGHKKYHEYIGSIADSGTTLLSKINDLLEIANIDSGRMELRESATDLGSVIRQAIEFHSHRAFCEQIHLRDRLPKRPLLAFVDRIRLLQVLTNVISNAIKYNRLGGSVEIGCEMRKDGGINITVEDNGGGIPASHLQNILSAFSQDNSFFARSRDCVGLGLALSKEIVKLHQGRIEIESETGEGTLLTIRLPKERTVKSRAAAKTLESARSLAVN